MPERIKLTEDDIYCHPSDTYQELRIEIYGKVDKKQLKQQILDDQEKAEKWNKHSKTIETILQLNKDFNTLQDYEITKLAPKYLIDVKSGLVINYYEKLEQENKKLKETIDKITNYYQYQESIESCLSGLKF